MNCPYCNRKLIKVFHGPPGDELGEESVKNTVIIGNCCDSEYNYYCEYCDIFLKDTIEESMENSHFEKLL